VDTHELAFAGAAQQARMLADGIITAPELLGVYLERIGRLDPELRSYRVVLADSAREAAAAAQPRLDAGEPLPLLGVPIAIKDDVDVAGEVTTYGSAAHGPARTADAEGDSAAAQERCLICIAQCVTGLGHSTQCGIDLMTRAGSNQRRSSMQVLVTSPAGGSK